MLGQVLHPLAILPLLHLVRQPWLQRPGEFPLHRQLADLHGASLRILAGASTERLARGMCAPIMVSVWALAVLECSCRICQEPCSPGIPEGPRIACLHAKGLGRASGTCARQFFGD